MKVVEKYQSFSEHVVRNDAVRKYGMMLVKHGLKGAAKRVNPVAMYIDAALSVCEAVSSYLNYAREREVTKQVLEENRCIEVELKSQLMILKLEQDTILAKGDERLRYLSERLSISTQQTEDLIKQLTKQVDVAKSMQCRLRDERENGCNFEQLQNLQKQLDHYLRCCLILITNNVD
ncbi:hypothetical protein ABVY78_001863 [Vibrio parahaemolyticus]